MADNTCKKPDGTICNEQNCTPEKIKECHGDESIHPCEEGSGCNAKKKK